VRERERMALGLFQGFSLETHKKNLVTVVDAVRDSNQVPLSPY